MVKAAEEYTCFLCRRTRNKTLMSSVESKIDGSLCFSGDLERHKYKLCVGCMGSIRLVLDDYEKIHNCKVVVGDFDAGIESGIVFFEDE